MATKSFTTSKKERDGEPVTFDLDGRTYTAHRPKQAAFMDLYGGRNAVERAIAIPRFIDAALDPKDAAILSARLRDENDDLDVDDLLPIFEYLMEEFTGRPTGSQTD